MAKLINSLVLSLLLAATVLIASCSNSPSPSGSPSVRPDSQPVTQPTSQSPSGQNSTSSSGTSVKTTTATQTQSPLPNRVDVIYFHVNQRCVTCLCFEEHINQVIEKYFTGAVDIGKLTYKVLNAQKAENADIARKYGAVGSQLFINFVTDGNDHIEDIQDIWNWNCRNNAPGFELKVKNVIEYNLKGLP